MGVFVLKNAHVTINSVDLSEYVRSVTLNYSAAIQDKTAMSANSMQRIAGLKDWSADIEFNQDFASGKVDATLFPLIGAAAFAIAIRPDAGAIATTNPEFQGNAVLESYPPISGAVGDLARATARLLGDGDLTRDITP